jgi:hypothetical protein
MKTVKTFKSLGYVTLEYISEVEAGIYYDTTVSIEGKAICAIEGNKLSEFHEAIEDVINKYRI